jgi:GT2 family glycosyltransferase
MQILARYGDRVKIMEEQEQSSYAARNTGIEAATGDFLAFTDSDCLPTDKWVENLVTRLQKSDVVGGHVVFHYTDTPSTAEIYDSLVHMQIGETISRFGVAATANLAVRKKVFSEVGIFPALKSSGDFVWTRKLREAGLTIEFAPDAIVHHSARSRKELLIKAERLGAGFYGAWKCMGLKFPGKTYLFCRMIFYTNAFKAHKKMKRQNMPETSILSLVILSYRCNFQFLKGYLGEWIGWH